MNILPFDNSHPFFADHDELQKLYQDIRIIAVKNKKTSQKEYEQVIAEHHRAGYVYLYEHLESGMMSDSLVVTFGLPLPEYRHNLHPYPLEVSKVDLAVGMRGYELRSMDGKKIAFYEHEEADKGKGLKEVIRLWMEPAQGMPLTAYSGVSVRSDKAGEIFAIHQVQPLRRLGEVALERDKDGVSIFGRDANSKVLIALIGRGAVEWGFLLGDRAGPLTIRCDPGGKESIFRVGHPCLKPPDEEAFILIASLYCLALLRNQVELLNLSS